MLQPPVSSFAHKDGTFMTQLLATMRKVDALLPSEILWTAERMPSTPQFLSIRDKAESPRIRNSSTDYLFSGFPQRRFDPSVDLWRVQYLVLKFRYANVCKRDSWGNPVTMAFVVPKSQGSALFNKLLTVSNQAPKTIKKVRLDMHYDSRVVAKGDYHVADIAGVWIRLFLNSKNVWAEGVESVESSAAREFVRSFNLTRRYVKNGHDPRLVEIFSCLAAKEDYNRKEYEQSFPKEKVQSADWFLQYTLGPSPVPSPCMVCRGEKQREERCVQFACPGCHVQFQSECGAAWGDEQHFLIREEWRRHRARMAEVKGSRCALLPEEEEEKRQIRPQKDQIDWAQEYFGTFLNWVAGESTNADTES